MTIKKGFQYSVLWYLAMSLILNNWNTLSPHKDNCITVSVQEERAYVKIGMPL